MNEPNIDPETKVLKGDFAGKNEQRERRPAYRQSVKKELKKLPNGTQTPKET